MESIRTMGSPGCWGAAEGVVGIQVPTTSSQVLSSGAPVLGSSDVACGVVGLSWPQSFIASQRDNAMCGAGTARAPRRAVSVPGVGEPGGGPARSSFQDVT
jgi:hypothetical protein